MLKTTLQRLTFI